ncbi:MAG: NAD(+) synthase, partial [Bacillus sp. (in: Bacteria)]|nr:NAD(+) synthase [Bacillus sp. (in: firmicutes)]
KAVPTDVAEKIEKRYTVSEHKRQVPASMFDDWWK